MKKILIRFFGAIAAAFVVLAVISQDENLRYFIGFIIGLTSLGPMIISRRQLGKYFSVTPEAKGLVVKGLYSKIQHPMYLFLDLFLATLILVLGYSVLLVPWGILVLVQIFQAQREERVLASTFGDEYSTYVSKTWF